MFLDRRVGHDNAEIFNCVILSDLSVGKIHFYSPQFSHAFKKPDCQSHTWMLRLELLQELHLFLLVAGHATGLLLALIVHHFLHHGTGFPVQVTQAGVLRLDLGDVDLGGCRDDVRPPLHFVRFVEVNADFLARGRRGGFKGP